MNDKLQEYIDNQSPELVKIETNYKAKDFKMGIFIINLKHREDKLKLITQKLKIMGILDYKIIDAVYGYELSEKEISEYTDPLFFKNVLDGNYLTRPEIGCSASHNKIYEIIINENYSHAIVFEDDSVIDKRFSVFLHKIKRNPFDFYFDFLLLGYSGTTDVFASPINKKVGTLSLLEFSEKAKKEDTLWGSHAYIISNSGAEKMLSINKKIKFRADGPWNFFYKNIKVYATKTKLANQIGSRNLQNDIVERSPSPID
jgi:glycosyl transferase family 25